MVILLQSCLQFNWLLEGKEVDGMAKGVYLMKQVRRGKLNNTRKFWAKKENSN